MVILGIEQNWAETETSFVERQPRRPGSCVFLWETINGSHVQSVYYSKNCLLSNKYQLLLRPNTDILVPDKVAALWQIYLALYKETGRAGTADGTRIEQEAHMMLFSQRLKAPQQTCESSTNRGRQNRQLAHEVQPKLVTYFKTEYGETDTFLQTTQSYKQNVTERVLKIPWKLKRSQEIYDTPKEW